MRRAKIVATVEPDVPAVPTASQLYGVTGGPITDLETTEADRFPQHRDDELATEADR